MTSLNNQPKVQTSRLVFAQVSTNKLNSISYCPKNHSKQLITINAKQNIQQKTQIKSCHFNQQNENKNITQQQFSQIKREGFSSGKKVGSSCIIYSKKSNIKKRQHQSNQKIGQYKIEDPNIKQSQLDIKLSKLMNDLMDLEQLNCKQMKKVRDQRQNQLFKLHTILKSKIEQNNNTLLLIKNKLQQKQKLDKSQQKNQKQRQTMAYYETQFQRQLSKEVSEIVLIDNSWAI